MIDSSSITLFLCASLGPWCYRESSVHRCLLTERCQSRTEHKICLSLFGYSAAAPHTGGSLQHHCVILCHGVIVVRGLSSSSTVWYLIHMSLCLSCTAARWPIAQHLNSTNVHQRSFSSCGTGFAEGCETSLSHSCNASTSAESSQARHWLEIRTSISWNICTHSSRCLVTLGCFVNPSVPIVEGTRPPAIGYALFFMGPWRVPIPGYFTFFTAIWRVFHPPSPMISMPTSPSESQLSIHP